MKKRMVQFGIVSLLILPTSVFAEEVTVTVKGMVCSFCAQGIKKTFGKNENVRTINVDLENKLVKVETKDGTNLSDKEIEKTINDAGYEVVKIERPKDV